MSTKAVIDAVDRLFVRCIASTDSLRDFRKAAVMVQRLARTPGRIHFAHLAAALNEQRLTLEMLRANRPQQARRHAHRRDLELESFYKTHERVRSP